MADQKYLQAFAVTGVANTDTLDSTGLTSTTEETKTVEKIIVTTSGQVGNTIRVWLEREKLAEIYDYNLDTVEASGSNMYKSTVKEREIVLNVTIPVGQTLRVSINAGGTAKNIFGGYVYTIA